MFVIVTNAVKEKFDELESTFNEIRGETFLACADPKAKTLGYVEVMNGNQPIVMKVTETSELMADWWNRNGGVASGISRCPEKLLIETADSNKDGVKDSHNPLGNEIGGVSLEDIGIETDDYIMELVGLC